MACFRKSYRGKLGLLLFCAGGALFPLSAQKVVSARAGLITYLQGPAFVDGKRVVLTAARFPQMKDGESLSTGRGRAEVLLAPGVVLRLAENSQVRMDDTELADTRVTLQRGDALIEVVRLADDNRIQVGLAETTTEFARAGLYRFGTERKTLRVYGGEALVRSGAYMASAKRGIEVDLDTDLNPGLPVRKFDRKQTDFLHNWAARRSFELFMGDPETRQKQTHWQIVGGGYVENKNFGVEFRGFVRRLPRPGRPAIPSADHP
jgi:FecR protein